MSLDGHFRLLALLAVLSPVPAMAARAPACRAGLWVSDATGAAPHLGAADGWIETIRIADGMLTLSTGCGATSVHLAARGRMTRVGARWTSCADNGRRSVRLKATLSRDCARLRGTLTVAGARPSHRRIRADAAPFPSEVPLDPTSPWPKFRRDARQTGRSPIVPGTAGGHRWAFPTGKGIFSSPVIGTDGTIYIGSADRTFYAIAADGTLRWKHLTGEIIDSSALLDDRGRVYVGSGDGRLYGFRTDGTPATQFAADPPSATGAFIDWFEGNVAITADGTLVVPNDVFYTYALDRDAEPPSVRWRFRTVDQTWSLPAYDVASDRLFLGNNNLLALLGDNTFALDAASGDTVWHHGTDGTIAASPLLTRDGAMVVGGFDGYVRAYEATSGMLRWEYGARDHIYASPAELSDGTIVQPSADGSVYGLDPATGAVRWQFDTRDALRSSPAVDGQDHVYLGSGEGRLFVLNPDGTLRWSLQLIHASRDDLNASPALGTDAIVIAGESGEVFSVPYDYCLRPGVTDPDCTLGPNEDLPAEGAHLFYTTQFGRQLAQAPASIEANQALAFTLFVRHAGDTQLAHLDATSLALTISPPVDARVEVSGDRKFVTIIPTDRWVGVAGGPLSVHLTGDYLVNPDRQGLRFTGGTVGGTFDETFDFTVPAAADGGALPLPVPTQPGDPAGVWAFSRVAAPLPTILPSYNQIGFDSIHYLIGLVEGTGDGRAIGWVVGAQFTADPIGTRVDPATKVLFPVDVRHDGGLLTFSNADGFSIEFNRIRLPFQLFRAATRVDAQGAALASPTLDVLAVCGGITFYGQFLRQLGFCNPQTDVLDVFGGAELAPLGTGTQTAPAGVGTVTFARDGTGISATLAGSSLALADHVVGLLAIDPATHTALSLDYGYATTRTANPDGSVASVAVPFGTVTPPVGLRVYLMVDAYPAARGDL